MTPNPYDQACRYLLKLAAVPLLAWLLRLAPEQLEFVEWLDARQVPWPGQPDRYCDTVAHLRDLKRGGVPWALVVEFQIEPDELMFGRGLRYLGDLWEVYKPTEHRGDRFNVGLVVVNLRGVGLASRNMRLTGTDVGTNLRVGERNLSKLKASKILKEIASGIAPRALLAWVPLFQGGDRPGIIPEWKRLAEEEKDVELRRALGLAIYFAEAAGCGELWTEALKEWNMVESKIFNEWCAKARNDGRMEGNIQGLAKAVLAVVEARFKSAPTDVVTKVNSCNSQEKLDTWVRQAGLAETLDDFRRSMDQG